MLGGYESFVSRIDVDRNSKDLSWLGKLDASSIKQKLAASIVAVSAIHLLQHFVNAAHVANDKLMWYVIIHLTFVVSALAIAIMDKISKKTD